MPAPCLKPNKVNGVLGIEQLDARMLLSGDAIAALPSEEFQVQPTTAARGANTSLLPIVFERTGDGGIQPVQLTLSPANPVQEGSIANRTVVAEGFGPFLTATSVPAISPALPDAGDDDIVVTYRDLLGPTELTAVVLKPRLVGGTYQIPIPSAGTDIYRFLRDHLEAAADQQSSVIRFPADHTFEIVPPNPTGSHLNLDELADVTIDLNGSTLQLTQISLGVKIEGSERVVLKNGTIKGVGQLATIARVVADDTPAGIRFEVLPEYRTDLEQSTAGAPQLVTVGRVEHTPAAGYRVKVDGYAELFINRGASTNNFVYEDGSFVATSALSSQPYTPGDFVWLLHQNNSGHGLLIDNEVSNEDVSLENIVFTNIPGMAIVGEVVRGLHISNVKIVKDANDPNAFFAASSDALHINANGGDIIVENSVFDANGDDKINIKGNYWKVTALDRGQKTMTVQPVERNTSLNRWGWADQRVVFLGRDFTVEGETELATDSFRDNSKRHDLVLKSIPDGVDVGSLIGNVDNSGPRVVIRNNIFRDTRAQGVLVQTSHAVIDNNLFEGIAGPAIKLNLALDYWYEAINTRNILIKHNTFFKSSLSTQKSNELIYFNQYDGFGNDVEAIDNVKIVGNQIRSSVSVVPPTSNSSDAVSPTEGLDEIEAFCLTLPSAPDVPFESCDQTDSGGL